jgi:hypothetical protein
MRFVRSGHDASVRTKVEARPRHFLAAALAWAVLAGAVAISFRPAVAVIWGDSPAFVESALRTLDAGTLTVVGGRDPGYPALLAATFALGGSLGTVVWLQQVAWAVLIAALAATVQLVTGRTAALVPIILLALYPGLLMFRNVISAELIYAVLLDLAVAALLVATCLAKTASCGMVAAAIIGAALAACCKSQGLLLPIAVATAGAFVARPDTPARIALLALSCAVAVALFATGSRFAAAASDEPSAVFVAKTLFCNHLNLELESEAARRQIAALAGPGADALLERLATEAAAEPDRWPVLGFFGDACMFDAALDNAIAYKSGPEAQPTTRAAAAYRRIFVTAVLDRPLAYAGKVFRQMAFGSFDAWPPFGLDAVVPASTDDVPRVSGLMARHGRTVQAAGLGTEEEVQGALLATVPELSTLLFRVLSAAFVVSMAWWSWIGLSSRGRLSPFFVRGGIVIGMWATSIVTAAAAHTLDVSRYLVPATPVVALMLSLSAAELITMVVRPWRSDDAR